MNDPTIGWIAAIIIGGIAGWLAEHFMKRGGVLIEGLPASSQPLLDFGLDLQHLAGEILGNLADAAVLHEEQLQVCQVVT